MDTPKFFFHVHYDPVWKRAVVFKCLKATKNVGIVYKKTSPTFSKWKGETDSIQKEDKTEERATTLYRLL